MSLVSGFPRFIVTPQPVDIPKEDLAKTDTLYYSSEPLDKEVAVVNSLNEAPEKGFENFRGNFDIFPHVHFYLAKYALIHGDLEIFQKHISHCGGTSATIFLKALHLELQGHLTESYTKYGQMVTLLDEAKEAQARVLERIANLSISELSDEQAALLKEKGFASNYKGFIVFKFEQFKLKHFVDGKVSEYFSRMVSPLRDKRFISKEQALVEEAVALNIEGAKEILDKAFKQSPFNALS